MARESDLLGIYTYADLLENLQNGSRLCSVEEYPDGTKGLKTHTYANENFIHWNYHGSATKEATERDMEFIVTEIFETTLREFIRRFV